MHQADWQENNPSLTDEAQQLVTVAAQLLQAEQRKWALRVNLLGKEWQLSLRAVAVGFCLALGMVIVGSVIWITLNLSIGAALLNAGFAWWSIGLGIMLINAAILLGLWNLMRRVMSQIGFSRSWASLTGGEAS